jgi:hypothetical protein
VARNTLILLRQATERGGLPVTARGNLSRAVVAEMCKLFEWPDYDQAAVLQFHNVINESDFLPLHFVRTLAQAATLVCVQGGKLVVTPLGKSMPSDERHLRAKVSIRRLFSSNSKPVCSRSVASYPQARVKALPGSFCHGGLPKGAPTTRRGPV